MQIFCEHSSEVKYIHCDPICITFPGLGAVFQTVAPGSSSPMALLFKVSVILLKISS